MTIKGRYVAQVEIEIEYRRTDKMRTLEEVREAIMGKEFTSELEKLIQEEICGEYAEVKLTKMYADVYGVETDDPAEITIQGAENG